MLRSAPLAVAALVPVAVPYWVRLEMGGLMGAATFIFLWISAVLARMAFLPVPNRARILPSDGFGMSCWTRAERVKNLFLVDS